MNGLLETKTKAKSTLLTMGVAIANTVGAMLALPQLQIPEGANDTQTITAAVLWLLNIIVIYMPTIVAAIASNTYVKEKTKQNVAVIGSQNTVTPAQPPETPKSPVEQPTKTIPSFDVESFHEKVMSTTEKKYTELNAATLFYNARDKGMVEKCAHISQAVEYWDYLISLAFQANDWIKESTVKTTEAGCKVFSAPYHAFQAMLKTESANREALYEVRRRGIDWKSKLGSSDQTLYTLGALSSELLK